MTSDLRIDLNADVGESFGAWRLGDDRALFEHVTSANIACGYHAGDPMTMTSTVQEAARCGVAIGAHPGYPDLVGFGRRTLRMAYPDVEAMVLYQIGALQAIAEANGARVAHVKPHGALYNDAVRDRPLADAIAAAVRRSGPDIRLVGLASSALIAAAEAAGIPWTAEAFCDRAYDDDGTLAPRGTDGAMLPDAEAAARQAVAIAVRGSVIARSGAVVAVSAQTLCIHGDTPNAASIARVVRAALEGAGVRVCAPA